MQRPAREAGLVLVLGPALLQAGCLGGPRLKGFYEARRYYPPDKHFSVKPPETLFPHGFWIEDDGNERGGWVRFSAYVERLEVDYMRLARDALRAMRDLKTGTREREKVLRAGMENAVSALARKYPDTRALYSEPIPSDGGGLLFGVLEVPGCHLGFDPATGDGISPKRGVLVFIKGPYAYALVANSSLSEKPISETADELRDLLMKARGSMEFYPPGLEP